MQCIRANPVRFLKHPRTVQAWLDKVNQEELGLNLKGVMVVQLVWKKHICSASHQITGNSRQLSVCYHHDASNDVLQELEQASAHAFGCKCDRFKWQIARFYPKTRTSRHWQLCGVYSTLESIEP
jgi:hypothetical protein